VFSDPKDLWSTLVQGGDLQEAEAGRAPALNLPYGRIDATKCRHPLSSNSLGTRLIPRRAEVLKGIPSMARIKERSFGQVLRERRRQLDLTQEEVARRIKTSTPYIGHLESAKRHPSDKIVTRLAEVLG